MSETATDLVAEFVKARESIHRLDSLGGSESFFGKEHIFGQLLYEEHEKDGLTDKGCYCFKGLSWYGNIVSWEPTLRAIASFLAHGHTREDLEALQKWYCGINATLDQRCLSAYLAGAFSRDDIKALLVESDKVQAELKVAEEARLAAIPHLSPPEDAIPFRHLECLEDFAGNHSQPGAWADVHVNDAGQEVVTFGGCWIHYVEGDDVLSKFMDGERGCSVESRPNKVKQLKKMSAEANEDSFFKIVKFLEQNHADLKFSEEFKWEKE